MNCSSSSRTRHYTNQIVVVLALLFSPGIIRGQETVNNAPAPRTTAPSTEESHVLERVRQLEAELEKQNNKLDQLQRTLTQQQLAIEALLEKLNPEKLNIEKSVETTAANAIVSTPLLKLVGRSLSRARQNKFAVLIQSFSEVTSM